MRPEEIRAADDPVAILRAQGEDYTASFPVVPNEVTNWIDEQRAITESVALADLSHHMSSLRVTGRTPATCQTTSASTASRPTTSGRPDRW